MVGMEKLVGKFWTEDNFWVPEPYDRFFFKNECWKYCFELRAGYFSWWCRRIIRTRWWKFKFHKRVGISE